jgi:hypothetical protein
MPDRRAPNRSGRLWPAISLRLGWFSTEVRFAFIRAQPAHPLRQRDNHQAVKSVTNRREATAADRVQPSVKAWDMIKLIHLGQKAGSAQWRCGRLLPRSVAFGEAAPGSRSPQPARPPPPQPAEPFPTEPERPPPPWPGTGRPPVPDSVRRPSGKRQTHRPKQLGRRISEAEQSAPKNLQINRMPGERVHAQVSVPN